MFIQRIDAAPLMGTEFTPLMMSWFWVLVDTLNTNFEDIEERFNLQTASSYTAAEITAMQSGGLLDDGVILYDTTNNVYVGRENSTMVKFTTTPWP